MFNIRSDPFPNGSDSHELLIRDINIDYSGNNVNHINPHLKYYPFECLFCKAEVEESRLRGDPDIKEVVKTSVKAMMRRHIIDKHLKKSPLTRNALEQEIERNILTLQIKVLEKVTKKEPTTPKTVHKRKKLKSVPGPPREGVSDLPKFLPQIFPTHSTIIKPIDSFNAIGGDDNLQRSPLIIPVGQLAHNLYLSFPSHPLMTSTPISKNQINSDLKTVIQTEVCLSSSEEELSDSDYDLMKDKSEVYGCVFCLKRFQNYHKVFDHYLLHCNAFIECAKCDLKFRTIGDFRSHNPLHNENCNLLNVNQYKNCSQMD